MRLAWLTGLALAPTFASGQEVAVETFTEPVAVDKAVPEFPPGALLRGEEALVEVHFMVDTEGHVFDPVIVDSTGSDDFREPALDALSRTRFEPARLNGEPIVGSSSYLYVFELEGGSKSASERFAGQYRLFQRALRSDDRERIEEALEALEATGANNHYEHAYLNLARYNYAARFGSDDEQLRYLRGALTGSYSPDQHIYLDTEVVTELRRLLLPLLLRKNLFPDALETYDKMREAGDDEGVAFYADTIARVEALERDATEYTIPEVLSDAGSVLVRLYKHHVALTGGEGELTEASLRCDQKYAAFAVERDISYDVPDAWGDCSLQIVGDPGASFSLLQH